MDSADSGQADLIFVFLGVSAFDFVIRKLEGLKGVAGRQRTPLPDSILVRNECAGERSSFHFFFSSHGRFGSGRPLFSMFWVSDLNFGGSQLESSWGVVEHQKTPPSGSMLVSKDRECERIDSFFFPAPTADSCRTDFFVFFGLLTSILVAGSWRARRGLQDTKELLPPAPSW